MVAVNDYVPYKIHVINIFWDKAMLYTKRLCIKKTKVKLIWIRTEEIHAQVIQGTFPSVIFLLRIVWIRRSLVPSTATHWRCFVNFFTKTLQGSLFQRLREVITGWAHVDILQDYVSPPNRERFGNHVSGDKPETFQKATYVQVINGNRIGKTDSTE